MKTETNSSINLEQTLRSCIQLPEFSKLLAFYLVVEHELNQRVNTVLNVVSGQIWTGNLGPAFVRLCNFTKIGHIPLDLFIGPIVDQKDFGVATNENLQEGGHKRGVDQSSRDIVEHCLGHVETFVRHSIGNLSQKTNSIQREFGVLLYTLLVDRVIAFQSTLSLENIA